MNILTSKIVELGNCISFSVKDYVIHWKALEQLEQLLKELCVEFDLSVSVSKFKNEP